MHDLFKVTQAELVKTPVTTRQRPRGGGLPAPSLSPSILDHQPSALSPQPSTLNPQLSTLDPYPTAPRGLTSAVSVALCPAPLPRQGLSSSMQRPAPGFTLEFAESRSNRCTGSKSRFDWCSICMGLQGHGSIYRVTPARRPGPTLHTSTQQHNYQGRL